MSDHIILEDIYAAAWLEQRGVRVDIIEDPARSRRGGAFTIFRVGREAAPLLAEYLASDIAVYVQGVKRMRDRSRNVRRSSA